MHILIAISQRLFYARSPLHNVYFTHVPHFLGKGVHVANMKRQHPNRHVPIKDSNAPDRGAGASDGTGAGDAAGASTGITTGPGTLTTVVVSAGAAGGGLAAFC